MTRIKLCCFDTITDGKLLTSLWLSNSYLYSLKTFIDQVKQQPNIYVGTNAIAIYFLVDDWALLFYVIKFALN